jgi:NAD(P)H-hydrate epimerase
LVVDALFGFSFKPPMREPYKSVISEFKKIEQKILSVDIPSGWDVEGGNTEELFHPAYLVSLTLPKVGVKEF